LGDFCTLFVAKTNPINKVFAFPLNRDDSLTALT
jgi:hypothetical protein